MLFRKLADNVVGKKIAFLLTLQYMIRVKRAFKSPIDKIPGTKLFVQK